MSAATHEDRTAATENDIQVRPAHQRSGDNASAKYAASAATRHMTGRR
jgi:hypothetical protein